MTNPSPISLENQNEIDEPVALFEMERRRLDNLGDENRDPLEIGERALAIFEAAALAGAGAWRNLINDDQLSRLESLLSDSGQLLAGFEQQLFAPVESGLRERALMLIEGLGHRDGGAARDAERLLHAAGESRAAYRIERKRRSAPVPNSPAANDRAELAGLVIAVAGGHPRLRKMIRRDLARGGIRDLREIPSAFEASRGGRDVAAKLGGADLTVMIVRQIAHSTSDQVTAAAARLGVPVAFSRSAGIAGVHREVDAFAAAKRGIA